MLKADIQKIDEFSILNTSVGPLNRVIYEASVTWASRAAKSPFWRPRKRTENVPLAKTFDELTRLPLLSEECVSSGHCASNLPSLMVLSKLAQG